MIIRNLDFLSPEITLYYKGRYKHSSIFSGIITILSYSVILACIIYYVVDFVDRSNPQVYYFNRYIDDAGSYPLNESSIFHYLNLIKASRVDKIEYDFNSIRIYGIQTTLDNYLRGNEFNYSSNNHWEYGLCNYNDVKNKKIKKLLDENIFSKSSACIQRYYDSKQKRYFNINESGFIWPTLEHGSSHPNRTVYGIVVEKCQNNSFKKDCNSEEEIKLFFKKFAMSFNFIDHYTDVLNYKEPFTTYIYSVTIGLTISSSITYNNLNFNPSLLRTHNGFLLENIVQEKSYSFIQNEKTFVDRGEKSIICAYYFWMQNNMVYNDRYYKIFQEILSNIGGLGSFILLIGFFINSFVSSYIILLDTQNLIFNLEEINFSKDKEINKRIVFIQKKGKEKKKEIIFQNKKDNKDNSNNNTLQNSNYPLFMTDKNDNKKSSEPSNILIIDKNKNKSKISNEKKHSCAISQNNKILTEYKRFSIQMKKSISENSIKRFNLEKSYFEIVDKNNRIIKKPIKKQKFSWCTYFLYVMLFKKKKSKLKFYDNFRAQIISEENLVQNNLDIYKLLEYCNIKRTNPFEIKI